MEYIRTEFSEELSALLRKHKKILTSDNSGIYIIDDEGISEVIIGRSETASEDSRDKMFCVVNFG